MDERIKKILDHLEENFKDSNDLKRLSGIACLSAYHFHRLFKKEVGVPLKKFGELLKLEKAYQELLNGQTNVRDLAFELGYNDYETFSRAFKKHYQVSPDIFKSIGIKVMEQAGATGGKLKLFIIDTDELDSSEEISEKMLEKLVREKFNLKQADLIKTFLLEPKNETKAASKENTIRNKYELKEENKIWEKVLQKLSSNDKGS